MKKQYAKRIFAGLMCISLVFQWNSVPSFAAETSEISETEAMETVENAEAGQSIENIDNTEAVESTETEENQEVAENPAAEQNVEMIEAENTDSTEETIVQGEFCDVSVVFEGYHAVLNAGYTLSSNAKTASFYLVSYNQDDEKLTSSYVSAFAGTDANTYTISNWMVNLYNEAKSVKLMARESDESGAIIETSIFSDKFIREQIPEFHFTAGEPKVQAGSVTVPCYFDGNMHRPDAGVDYFTCMLRYGIEDVDENSSDKWNVGIEGKGEEKEAFSITVRGLDETVTYHAKLLITIPGPDTELGNIYEQTIDLPDFTTPADEIYDLEKEFPDAVFRGMIRSMLSLDESATTVKESQLGTITFLGDARYDITTPSVKDIKGIELLRNVNHIELGGHEISDVSSIEWKNLSELTYLSLRGNCIEILPDLTENTKLSQFYISNNYISSTDILNRQDKLPESCSCWDYSQRQKEFKLITEEKYFRTNEKSEIGIRVQGYNEWFPHTFKTYIDDNPIELEKSKSAGNDGYGFLLMYHKDIPYEVGMHTLKFEMYEGTSEELVVSKEMQFEIVKQEIFLEDGFHNSSEMAGRYYLSGQEETFTVRTYSVGEISEVHLVKDGMIYGKNEYLNSNKTDISISKYPNLGIAFSSGYYCTYANININKRQLPTGVYDLKFILKDSTEEILEETVEVVNTAIVKSVSAGNSYDNTGEYLYLALTADHLDPSRIVYTIKNDADNQPLQTEYVDYKPFYGGYVVKLKKTGWAGEITNIGVRLSGKEEYPLYTASSYTHCWMDNVMYFSDYNFRSNMLEIGITAQTNISDYTFSIVRSDSWDFTTEHIQEEYETRLEKVEDTIYHVIPKWEGEDCTLYGGYYRFSMSRSDEPSSLRTYQFYIPGLVIERSVRLEDQGNWGETDYNLVQQGTRRVSRNYYSGINYIEGNAEDFSAQITGESLETPLDAQLLHTYAVNIYKTGIGIDFDCSALDTGNYTIELYYLNDLLSIYEFQVIPDNIFVLYDNLYASWESEDSFYVNVRTPNGGDTDDYMISLTDINGNKIEGLTVSNLYKDASASYVTFYVSGLKKSESDRGYYMQLLHKTKGDAYCKDLKTRYYSGYGKYTKIGSNVKCGWNSLFIDNVMQGYSGIWQSDATIFPATLTIYKFNGTESLYSAVLTEEDFDGGSYYFTQELIDALPRAEGYYDLVFIGNAGQFLNEQRAHLTLNEDVLNAFRVVPSSMTLKLDVAEESSKTITAFNSTETPTFESDDTTIADVKVSADNPDVATVEAVGVGRTSITVISGRDIKKVTVVVTETPIEPENIQFQEEKTTAIQGTTIAAAVKVEPEKAWTSSRRISYTSSDETIVSVGDSSTRNIMLTANNPGTATITARLEGTSLTAQCAVTVVAGFTEEEKSELISAVGSLYFLEGAEHTLADIKLPEGWRWSNPSQRPMADFDRPTKEFAAIYTKDGLDYFSSPLSVHVTSVNTKITGAADMQISTVETYKMMYEFVGYKPADNTTYAASFKWVCNDNLVIQGTNDQDEVTIQSGATPGSYALQGTIYIKNTKTGEEFTDTLSITITVKDNTDEINEALMKKTYYFLSGADAKLGDVPIGDGWSWVRPGTVPQADEAIQVQKFAAQYASEGRQPTNARLSVAVSALDKVSISGAVKVAAEKTSSYQLKYQFSGYDINDSEGYDISYHWKGSDGIVIEGADNADTVTIRTGNTPGNYMLSAEVTVTNRQTGKSSKAEGSYQVQILDKNSIDSITIRPAKQQPQNALACTVSNGVLESDYAEFDKGSSFLIQLAADAKANGVSKGGSLQWASSDTKTASIDHTGLVIVKKAGITVISATSTDTGGYSEEIVLRVQDYAPAINNKSITVFQYSSMGTEIGIIEQNNNAIQSINVVPAGLKAEKHAGIWYLQASGYSGKVTENATLTISTGKGQYEVPLKVTVNVTQPKASLKQSVKPNIFYTDAEAVYKVTSKYAIEDIEDASGATENCFHVTDYDVQAGLLTMKPYGISENIENYKTKNSDALKAKIKITFEGYEKPVEMTVKVNVQNKRPSLRIDTAVFIKNTGMDEALTAVRNGKRIYHLDNAVVETKTENISASVFDGKLKLNYNGASNTSYKVNIQADNWTQAMTVSGKIQMINANTLELQAETTKVIVNKANLSTITIPVAVKGNSSLEPDISLDCDSSAMTAVYQNGVVEIDVSENAADKIYSVVVGGTLEVAGSTINIKKTVIKVTVTSKEASVKLFASGKIDIADRKYSSTIYTPTLKNMDAAIISAEVTGDMSEYFYAYLDESDKIVLKAISGKPLKANTKYEVDIAADFDNGYQTVTKVNIKPVNKLPKIKTSLSKGILHKAGADSRLGIRLLLDARYSISKVKLIENLNSEYFTLSRDDRGLVTIALSENGAKIPSGTYTVSYQILIEDADNEKPIIKNIKITVK